MLIKLLGLVKTPNILEILSFKSRLSNEEMFLYLLLSQFKKDDIEKKLESIVDERGFIDSLITLCNILNSDIFLGEVRNIENYFNFESINKTLDILLEDLYDSFYAEFIYHEDVFEENLLCSNLLDNISNWRDFNIKEIDDYDLPNMVKYKLFLLNYYIPLKYQSYTEFKGNFLISFENIDVIHKKLVVGNINHTFFDSGGRLIFKVGDNEYKYDELDRLVKENKHLLHLRERNLHSRQMKYKMLSERF